MNNLNTFSIGLAAEQLGFFKEFTIENSTRKVKGGNGAGFPMPSLSISYSFKLYEYEKKSVLFHACLSATFNPIVLDQSYQIFDLDLKYLGDGTIETKLTNIYFASGFGLKNKFNKFDFIEIIPTFHYRLLNGLILKETYLGTTSTVTIKPSKFIVSLNFKYYFH